MNLSLQKDCIDPEREAKTYLEDMIVKAPGNHDIIESARIFVDEHRDVNPKDS